MELRSFLILHVAPEVIDEYRAVRWRSEWLWPALLFIVVALVSRSPMFGNPVIHIDEQFYLLVGQRMHAGMLPYIDIWDRKPIGLFLIYWASALGGGGIYAYQLAACAAAAATAFLVYRIALRIAEPAGAMVAGVGYLLFLLTFRGVGGQSPVFYNLIVVAAVLGTMRVLAGPKDESLLLKGMGIMLLLGIAIQVKYSVVFEGIFIGLALMWRCWRERASWAALVLHALAWVACALLPTGAALAYYAFLGEAGTFIHANFLSVFGREEPLWEGWRRLAISVALLTPFWIAAVVVTRKASLATGRLRAELLFVRLWTIAATLGYLIFGSYYDHYVLPLLPPLAILAAPALARHGKFTLLAPLLLLTGGISGGIKVYSEFRKEGNRQQVEHISSIVAEHLNGGCLHVFEGPPIVYSLTGACISTRFVFPSHLNHLKEASALGVSVPNALKEMLARRPTVIIADAEAKPSSSNMLTRQMLWSALGDHYRLVAPAQLGRRKLLIFALK